MSHLLEILGQGLGNSLEEMLSRHYWAPAKRPQEQLEELCRQHPDWPDLHFQLGLCQLRSLQPAAAIASLLQSCRHKPEYLAAHVALACAYVEEGQTDQALEHLKIANELCPGEAAVLFAIGFCHEKLADPKQAASYYGDAVSRDGTFQPARQRLAAVAVATDQLDVAIEQYEALAAMSPQESWIKTALAHLCFRHGRFGDSVRHFETAIAMEPANWSLVDDEVEALVQDGQLREAIARLNSLLEQQGPFADLHLRLADLHSQAGEDDQATQNYLKARELQPGYLEAAVKLGTHHLIYGRWDQAAEAFCEGAELNDHLLVNYVGLGVAHARAGQRSEAMKTFDLAAAIEPNSSILLAEMARLQLKAAVADEFTRSFELGEPLPAAEVELANDHLLGRQLERHDQEVQRHPGHADLRYRYGVLLRAEGKLGEALEQLGKAVELNPAYVQAIIKLGITQQELGMTQEAIETFAKALEIKPQFVDLHYRLGLLYTDRRDFEQAVREMEAAAAGAPDNEQVRAGLALSLQNMGLMDRAAATWRSLWKLHHAKQDAAPNA